MNFQPSLRAISEATQIKFASLSWEKQQSNLDCRVAALLAMTLLFLASTLSPARADDAAILGAQQAVGLFSHTCLLYPLRKEELRARLKDSGIPPLSPEANGALLNGAAGEGFDASNQLARMALISADNDVCTVIGEQSDEKELIKSLEANLKVMRSSINSDYHLVDVHDDDHDSTLHHRDYLVTIDNQPFNLVVSTSDEPNRIQAFMSFGPHTPYNAQDDAPVQSEAEPVQ